MKKILLIISIALVAFACNKTKVNSNRLMSAGEWEVTELSVDGTNEDELPHWHIDDCEIYGEKSCFGEWKNEEGGETHFIWQFRDKGKVFEISRQEGMEEEEDHADDGDDHDHDHDHGTHDHATEEAIEQCYNFSGVYDVVSSKKDEMGFTSTSAVGFAGETVKIKIKKK